MRTRRRRAVAAGIALAAALVATLAATALSAGAASPKKIRIAYFAPLANTYVQGELRGIAGVMKKEKNIELVKFDTGFDATKQFNSVQDAITQKKFDGFIVLPLDSVGLVPAVQQAIKAGIKVVNADTPPGACACPPRGAAGKQGGEKGAEPRTPRSARASPSCSRRCRASRVPSSTRG